MKKTVQSVFTILVFAVLIARLLAWVLNVNRDIDKVVNTAMFSLIGIAYIVAGFVWDKKLPQLVLLICGVVLIVQNFLERNTTLDIIGIVCLLLPMVMARFGNKEEKELA